MPGGVAPLCACHTTSQPSLRATLSSTLQTPVMTSSSPSAGMCLHRAGSSCGPLHVMQSSMWHATQLQWHCLHDPSSKAAEGMHCNAGHPLYLCAALALHVKGRHYLQVIAVI